MKFIKSTVPAALLALGTSFAAQAVNVGGVHWDPTSLFDFTSNSQIIEDQLDLGAGQNTLNGFGKVTGINNTFEATFCPSGCELTFEFGGFTVAAVQGAGDDVNIAFTGGWVNFYVDKTTAYDGNDISSATDGNLWLSMAAHQVFDAEFGMMVSLTAELTSFGAGTDAGQGSGLLDVTGGLAAGNFNTDTQTDGADWVFSSSFQPLPNGNVTDDGFELFGTADFRGESIPEPSSIALLGLGIAGLGFGARRRKAAK